MTDIDRTTYQLIGIDIKTMETIAALGDMVIAQNAALIEISKILRKKISSKDEMADFDKLGEALAPAQEASQEFLRLLRSALARAKEAGEVDGNA
ncbi:hypothetical protein [Pseudomonas fragariae (ex Marin et al. 2024)]|uniref:hypothetical protein n=1 Tax=Pseudomonas fragariae (ex Marin et al. 2024) TaxID=3080056 RepID=UPI003F79C370